MRLCVGDDDDDDDPDSDWNHVDKEKDSENITNLFLLSCCCLHW